MSHEPATQRARAYLLGASDERETDAIEQEYFRSDAALETVEAAEEALIEDYLARRLPASERLQFEQHYLSTPQHRTRVETIRRLSTNLPNAEAATGVGWSGLRLLAIAAGLIVAIGAGVWIAKLARPAVPNSPIASAPAPATPAPVVFAWTVSPVTVRAASDTPPLVVPAGTDLVRLQFEGEVGARAITRGRVLIRTVAGADVWQGSVSTASGATAGVIAVVDAPSERLRPEDYTIALFETDPTGVESERARYFLRVRAR